MRFLFSLIVAFLLLATSAFAKQNSGLVEFFPSSIGSISKFDQSVVLTPITTRCFQQLKFTLVSPTGNNGPQIQVSGSGPISPLCSDYFLLASREQMQPAVLTVSHPTATVQLKPFSASEQRDVQLRGYEVFQFEDPTTIGDLINTVLWFFNAKKAPDAKMQQETMTFLQNEMGNVYTPRKNPNTIWLDETSVFPGDILELRIYAPLSASVQWGTTSVTDHVAIVLDIDGVLTVVESTEPGVISTPFNDWVCQRTLPQYRGSHTCPTSPYQTSTFPPQYLDLVVLPLSPKSRASFNNTKAVEFYKSVAGNEYGYQDFMWGWIDTADSNWPGKLTTVLFTNVLLPLLELAVPQLLQTAAMAAWNNRLNTNFTKLNEFYDELDRRSMTFGDLIAMPELDSYLYDGKPAMVCSGFATRTLVAGGVFDALGVQLNGNEFHPRDVYELKIYDATGRKYPADCFADNAQAPFCQISGQYVVNLPTYNTIAPYNRMNEKCPRTDNPADRPAGC